MEELEQIKLRLRLKDNAAAAAAMKQPFQPRKMAGSTHLSSGLMPELNWEGANVGSGAATPSAPGPQQVKEDSLAFLGLPPGPQPGAPAELPNFSSGIALRGPSAAALERHAITPMSPSASPVGGSASYPQYQQQQGTPALRMTSSSGGMYPALDITVPPAAPPPPNSLEAQLASIEVSVPSAPPLPLPMGSPYQGVQLGPQEVGVVSVAPPTGPTPPHGPGHDSCDVPAPLPDAGSRPVKRQSIRDVYVSTALMDEFLR
jgi:hypothetical protein